MRKDEKILDKIIQIVIQTDPDSEIYLFGSPARGDFQKLSDWDLLILLNLKNLNFNLETKFMDEFYEIELETGQIISPLIYTKNDWVSNHSVTSLYKNIQKEGIKVK
ncbi:MAG: nucleotidyltransferase domain-containing protein [Saprospiraceae bacterium]|nr:nucleotidyltransferase domain-containing protein [Saprospiraceae bacterium]